MGSKGAQTTTNQTQTYTPNPQAAGYITNALDRGQIAANNQFAIPQAPVAGFSQDQQGAFQGFRDAQGAAQPYYNQAANFYNQSAQGPDISKFFNPYAGAVGASMRDLYGQQNSQNTGQLTQAAGGVGADRIAVGQAELAKQQDLAYGQTMASLYQPSLQAAMQQQGVLQNAAAGYQQLGANTQNSQLQGSNALLGSGGLQQQLAQAQMNSPYQQQLAQAAFPYQQAQFLAGITGSLAPGLGGTTTGQGQSTAPGPSIWSQLLGGGAAIAGGLGATGAFGDNGYLNSNSANYAFSGPTSMNGGLSPAPGTPAATGGRIPYAEGGNVDENPYTATMGGEFLPRFAEGGIPNSDPIDISKLPMIPNVQLQPMQSHQQQLNLNPPQQSQQSGGPGIADIAKLAMMFAADGGRVNPYAGHYGDEGDPGGAVPYRMPDRPDGVDPMDAWRRSTDADLAATPPLSNGRMTASASPPTSALPFAGADAAPDSVSAVNAYAPVSGVPLPRPRPEPAGLPVAAGPAESAEDMSPVSRLAPAPAGGVPGRDTGLSANPWAALMAAGLATMAGTSPYAGVNIGQGGLAGMKALQEQRAASQKDETSDQAARRLAQEAQFHNDQYTKMTPYQKATLDQEKYAPAGSIQTKDGLHPAFLESRTGKLIDGITGQPPEKSDTVIPKGGSRNSPEEISSVVDSIVDGSQPPTLTGLYGDSVHVRAGLKAKNFNLAKAQQEWDAAKKLTASVNAPRMVAYVGLNKSVDRTIDEVKELADQLKQGGVPLLNKLQLMSYIKTEGNSEKGQLATRYMTAVNTLREEFANLANGGYAPTEAAWKLANEQVNGDFGVKQMHASLDEIQRLIRYRIQAVPGLASNGPGSANRYTAPAAAAPAPSAGGATKTGPASKPDVTTRFNELIGGGKTEEETYAILREEGYR